MPSGHLMKSAEHSLCIHYVLDSLHVPSSHLTGLCNGHTNSVGQSSIDALHDPSGHYFSSPLGQFL